MISTLEQIPRMSADRFPDREAFVCGDERLSFAEFEKITGQLAARLIDLGIEKGDRVGIYLNRSIETAVAVYGTLRAGAAFVPLDPTAPAARTRFVIEDCGIDVVISHSSKDSDLSQVVSQDVGLAGVVGSEDQRLAESVVSWEQIKDSETLSDPVALTPEDIAYVMYTSGTTGLPKGIVHTHGSGLSYAELSRDLYGVNESDRLLSHSPLHFDISTMSYLTMPLSGGTTIIASDGHVLFPSSLATLAEAEKATIWYSVPYALSQVLLAGALDKHDLGSLRWILFGGEPFPVKHLRELLEKLPHATFSNVYGPAEVNQCTFYNFDSLAEEADEVPLGQVWQKTRELVVDKNDQPVPAGEVGELLISAPTMMAGYWHQDRLTARVIREVEVDGELRRFYRTGDLVSKDEDGNLFFEGRRDRQIKIKGHRIELDGIESTAMMYPNVIEAAAYTYKNQSEENAIGVSVVVEEGEEIAQEELEGFMHTRLPRYVVFEKIEITEEIPRTKAGKIDHSALAKLTSGAARA